MPTSLLRIDTGWACSAVTLSDGRRQITGFYLPGDLCDPGWVFGSVSGAAIMALSQVCAANAPLEAISRALPRYGRTYRTLVAALLENAVRQRDWIVALGRRSAIERVGLLLGDLFERRAAIGGLYHDGTCECPLTQTDIADASGLTPIHVNRVMQRLRAAQAVELSRQRLRINRGELSELIGDQPSDKLNATMTSMPVGFTDDRSTCLATAT